MSVPVARVVERRKRYKVLVGKSVRKRPFGNLDVDGKIILKYMLSKLEGVNWNFLLRKETSCGLL